LEGHAVTAFEAGTVAGVMPVGPAPSGITVSQSPVAGIVGPRSSSRQAEATMSASDSTTT
jgi:hypothetical protein